MDDSENVKLKAESAAKLLTTLSNLGLAPEENYLSLAIHRSDWLVRMWRYARVNGK